jgi:hypothetical protein
MIGERRKKKKKKKDLRASLGVLTTITFYQLHWSQLVCNTYALRNATIATRGTATEIKFS